MYLTIHPCPATSTSCLVSKSSKTEESTFSCQFNKTPVLYDAGCSIPLYRYFINISCESISNAFKCEVISVVLTAFNTSITLAVCWAWIVSKYIGYIVLWLGWELVMSHRVDNWGLRPMQTEYLLVEGKNGLAGLSTVLSQPDPGRREGFRGRVH